MSITISRWTRLAVLGAGLATAAAFSLSTAGSALADPVDGTGSATITFSTRFLTHLAQSGIVIIPESPATSSDTNGADTYTFTVTGGNGTDTNFTGDVDLGGALTLIDGITGEVVHLTDLQVDYYDGAITGVPEGTTKPVFLFDISGALATNNSTGQESFSASQLTLDPQGAAYLNTALKSITVGKRSGKTFTTFIAGTTTIFNNAFTVTYAVTIT
jgi:hypothetical protein